MGLPKKAFKKSIRSDDLRSCRRYQDPMDMIMILLLMAEILHQLRLVVFPIIYRVSAPSQVVIAGFQPSKVWV